MIEQELALILINKINLANEKLHQFLVDSGVQPDEKKLGTLLDDLNKIRVLVPTKKYFGVYLDDMGYIKNISIIDELFEAQELPEDIFKGYYRIDEHGKLIRDDVKRAQLWEE